MKRLSFLYVWALLVVFTGVMVALPQAEHSQQIFSIGYEDTPTLPGSKWRVHDAKRPQPRMVEPGSFSAQGQPGQPPSDAVVLFDGGNLVHWRSEKGAPAEWKVRGGYVEVAPKSGDIYTREEFGDIQLHVEWSTPTSSQSPGPIWGNSGVFLYGVYEVQVWDSHHSNRIYADGQAGAIYGQFPPLVNASQKPGEWQVFDILFTAPRFKDGVLQTPAYLTVLQNGVVIHNHTALLGEMGHRVLPPYVDRGPRGPVRLQDHGEPVRYRNIWIRAMKGYDEP